MKFDESQEDDPLAELLSPPRLSTSDAVRDVVLMQAAGVLRTRRWIRRGSYAVSLGICYLAGLATMALVRHDDRQVLAVLPDRHESVGRESTNAASAASAAVVEEATASADEVVPTQSSFRFFRAAGDYQLLQRGNLQAAIRLYAQALELASPSDLAISAGSDSWLLMSLKQSRLQDVPHVHDEG